MRQRRRRAIPLWFGVRDEQKERSTDLQRSQHCFLQQGSGHGWKAKEVFINHSLLFVYFPTPCTSSFQPSFLLSADESGGCVEVAQEQGVPLISILQLSSPRWSSSWDQRKRAFLRAANRWHEPGKTVLSLCAIFSSFFSLLVWPHFSFTASCLWLLTPHPHHQHPYTTFSHFVTEAFIQCTDFDVQTP